MIIAAIISVVVICRKIDSNSRQYSGEAVNLTEHLCFDVSIMGDFDVIESKSPPDGTYSEQLLAKNAVNIYVRRDFTRPDMSCKKQIKEKYPKLSSYSTKKVHSDSIISERAEFTQKYDGIKYRHTVLLLRHNGWDYLVDFSVSADKYDDYSEYIDNLIDSLFYL